MDLEVLGVAFDSPVLMVDEAVVGMAEQDEVVEVREASVGPLDDVVGLRPAWGPVTAREPAAPGRG